MIKKTVLIIFLLFTFLSPAQGADITFNGPIFIGELPFFVGFGSGQLFINGETISDVRGNDDKYVVEDPYYITFGMAGPVTKTIHFGAELGFFSQSARPKVETDPTFRHELLSFILSLKYFPAESGFFTKFGLGWCVLDSVEDKYDPVEADIHDDYQGYTALIGIGYELVGEKFHVGCNLEYSRQTYEDDYDESGTLIDNSHIYSDLVTFSIRFGWY